MTEQLADHTTLRVGGPAAEFVSCHTEGEIIAAVRQADDRRSPVLLLAGGSNLLVADEGFPGRVVHIASRGVRTEVTVDRIRVIAAAGEPWDEVVAATVDAGWSGLEAMSWIPGSVGATPVQNVGAYGQEVSQTIESVRVLDRDEGVVRVLSAEECGFAYRSSVFKHEPHRWVVLEVTYALSADPHCVVRYEQLADALGLRVGDVATTAHVRDAVGALRRAKGMVLDPDDPDTASAGSFFVNPVVDAAVARTLPEACPRYPAVEGVKLSAAWLIEQSGITRGWQLRPGARVSTKHTLALTNAGGATASDVLDLARAIRSQVLERFGIGLSPEPTLIGCAL